MASTHLAREQTAVTQKKRLFLGDDPFGLIHGSTWKTLTQDVLVHRHTRGKLPDKTLTLTLAPSPPMYIPTKAPR